MEMREKKIGKDVKKKNEIGMREREEKGEQKKNEMEMKGRKRGIEKKKKGNGSEGK